MHMVAVLKRHKHEEKKKIKQIKRIDELEDVNKYHDRHYKLNYVSEP